MFRFPPSLLGPRLWRLLLILPLLQSPLKVFDMEACQRRLSGGYITLLFSVAAATDAGRELVANTGLWTHLANMGCQVRLQAEQCAETGTEWHFCFSSWLSNNTL